MNEQMQNLKISKALSILHDDSLKWKCIENTTNAFYSENDFIHVKAWLALDDICILLNEKNKAPNFTIFSRLFKEDHERAMESFNEIKQKAIQQ